TRSPGSGSSPGPMGDGSSSSMISGSSAPCSDWGITSELIADGWDWAACGCDVAVPALIIPGTTAAAATTPATTSAAEPAPTSAPIPVRAPDPVAAPDPPVAPAAPAEPTPGSTGSTVAPAAAEVPSDTTTAPSTTLDGIAASATTGTPPPCNVARYAEAPETPRTSEIGRAHV